MHFILKLVIIYVTIVNVYASHPHFSVFRTANTVRCGNGRFIIPSSLLCDGHFDCPDRSDETNCELPSTVNPKDSLDSSAPYRLNITRCGFGRALCSGTTYCIPLAWFCDGEDDCSNGFDEESCSYVKSSDETKRIKERLNEEPVDQSTKFAANESSGSNLQLCNNVLIFALMSLALRLMC